ncbi:MAG: YkgJ family cysteine cluster protein [Desulfobacterales bacterium]|nr:YkgJ family cysteine cluster protein [Desulfobacterales bacterium]
MPRDSDTKRAGSTPLTRLYEIHEQFVSRLPFACKKGCAVCCTRSVTMTSLEGRAIAAFLEQARPDLVAKLKEHREVQVSGRPLMTTNQFAAACLARREIPAEAEDPWCLSPCFFLEQDCCAIYPLRPFGCRSFASLSRCAAGGAAESLPFLITVNTVLLQIIEELAFRQGGYWGRMDRVLARLLGTERASGQELVPARPLPGFLVEPEEWGVVTELFSRLKEAGLGDWREWLVR